MSIIETEEQLEALYGQPGEPSLIKELEHVSEHYRAFIDASPFVALATSGPEGLDCSPRGDLAGFVRVADAKTLMLPDRRGNNRTDSLKNIIGDPRVALLFLVPGSGTTLRVNGRARITTDPELLESFSVDGKAPRSVMIVAVDAVYFQCSRAIVRSRLWDPELHVDPKSLPSAGEILAKASGDRLGGAQYDKEWPDRAREALW